MNKIIQILSLCAYMIFPLHAHTKDYPNSEDILLWLALMVGVPLLIIGTIIYLIVKKKQDMALRLSILFIILGIFYYLLIGF